MTSLFLRCRYARLPRRPAQALKRILEAILHNHPGVPTPISPSSIVNTSWSTACHSRQWLIQSVAYDRSRMADSQSVWSRRTGEYMKEFIIRYVCCRTLPNTHNRSSSPLTSSTCVIDNRDAGEMYTYLEVPYSSCPRLCVLELHTL
jgi:hypothetical protein